MGNARGHPLCLRLCIGVPEAWCLAPGVKGAFLCHRCRVREPTGNRDDLGIAKALRLDVRQHQPVVAVVVAECTIISTAKCPEGDILGHVKFTDKQVSFVFN